ncbi:MAG: transcription elongation factor GreA [Parcubacteria group bacterium Greene0416_79]|nr:MAG: transcription elongation factor GreA [Parcubacteria group bacterium Greene0416_79]
MTASASYFTKEKYAELEKELEHLKTVRRKEVAENLEYAKSLGDLSENAEYHEAREMQANIEDRIQKLEVLLQSAVIMKPHHSEVADIGSVVTVERSGGQEQRAYNLVSSEESNISKGKLSVDSPLGQAMLGKKKGETFTAKTPGGAVEYLVTDIA